MMEASKQDDVQLYTYSQDPIFKSKCQCCCKSHCMVSLHNYYGTKTYYEAKTTMEKQVISMSRREEMQEFDMEDSEDVQNDVDNFTSLIMSVGMSLA